MFYREFYVMNLFLIIQTIRENDLYALTKNLYIILKAVHKTLMCFLSEHKENI